MPDAQCQHLFGAVLGLRRWVLKSYTIAISHSLAASVMGPLFCLFVRTCIQYLAPGTEPVALVPVLTSRHLANKPTIVEDRKPMLIL